MEILTQPSHAEIRRFVRSFGQRRVSLTRVSVTTPLAARPDQFIEFYLGERYRVSVDDGPSSLTPETAVVGPQTRPGLRLHMSGELDVFTMRFQPTGFHRLFGVPMPALADQGIAIAELLGRTAAGLEDAIRRADSFEGRVIAAQRWLAVRADKSSRESGVDHAARLLVAARGRARIDAVAERSGLSLRQFQRRFTAEVGVPPKFYSRTLRLEAALAARNRYPERSWTTIVHDAGYADQAHFIRDCQLLAGATPTSFVAQSSGMTEMFNYGTA
ncbi:helix-turn-helix domain-containing protein [Sphingopyxis sp.]|uniref:helix-turn-helix domain-containing protein n=1 Tax=Sphingopyxis sp. TaxID=1908224 RepID=UPI003D0CB0F6